MAKLKPRELRADDGVRLVDQIARLHDKRQGIKEQLAELDAQEEALFDQLAALAEQLGVESVSGRTHHVEVRTKTATTFPGAGDPSREAFERAVRKAGLWDQLATLNVQKLKSLWNRGLSPPAEKLLRKFVTEKTVTELKLKKGGVQQA